jgi:hypothetical protein
VGDGGKPSSGFQLQNKTPSNSVQMNTMPPPSAKIIQLRQILAQRFALPAPTPTLFVSTGLPRFDQALGGGLLRGTITQLVAPLPSSGSSLILNGILHGLQQQAQLAAFVDGANCFEPVSTTNHFLWVRCQHAAEAVKAADLLLRDGNIPVTILDLKQNSAAELQKIPGQTWYRLQRITEEMQTTLFLLTRHPMAASAGVTLQVSSALALKDLSTFSSDLIASLSFEVHRRKAFRESSYA